MPDSLIVARQDTHKHLRINSTCCSAGKLARLLLSLLLFCSRRELKLDQVDEKKICPHHVRGEPNWSLLFLVATASNLRIKLAYLSAGWPALSTWPAGCSGFLINVRHQDQVSEQNSISIQVVVVVVVLYCSFASNPTADLLCCTETDLPVHEAN